MQRKILRHYHCHSLLSFPVQQRPLHCPISQLDHPPVRYRVLQCCHCHLLLPASLLAVQQHVRWRQAAPLSAWVSRWPSASVCLALQAWVLVVLRSACLAGYPLHLHKSHDFSLHGLNKWNCDTAGTHSTRLGDGCPGLVHAATWTAPLLWVQQTAKGLEFPLKSLPCKGVEGPVQVTIPTKSADGTPANPAS